MTAAILLLIKASEHTATGCTLRKCPCIGLTASEHKTCVRWTTSVGDIHSDCTSTTLNLPLFDSLYGLTAWCHKPPLKPLNLIQRSHLGPEALVVGALNSRLLEIRRSHPLPPRPVNQLWRTAAGTTGV